MAYQTWQTLINAYQYSGNNSGTELKESTSLTDISPGGNTAGQALVIPGSLLIRGSVLRFTASGLYSNTGTPKLTLGLYWGAVAGTALGATIEVTTPSAVTNQPFILSAITRVKEVGAEGKAITQGSVLGIEAVSATAASAGVTLFPETTEATINTGEAKMVTLGAKWGTSSASNKIQCLNWLVELMN